MAWKKYLLEGDASELGDATPEAVDGTGASAGTATTASRIDHIHANGPLVANLDFDGFEADDFKLETQATEPTAGTVAGRIYYNSSPGTVHPFVFQA